MTQHNVHLFEEIVRFEDVDAAAIVYHPVYLNYLERARSQSLRDNGSSFKKVLEEGFGIVIAAAEMKYVRPLALEDIFFVATQVNSCAKSIITMTQAIAMKPDALQGRHLKEELRQIETLRFYAHLKLVVISRETKQPVPMPEWLSRMFLHYSA